MAHVSVQDGRLFLHLTNLPRTDKPQEDRSTDVHEAAEQDSCSVTSAIDPYELKPNGFGDYKRLVLSVYIV